MIGRKPRAGLGASSILLILVVLCLAAFATLTFVSARLDLNLTERTLAAEQAYYRADANAQAAIAQLDAALCAGAALPAGWTEADGIYTQRFALSDDLSLEVAASLDAGALRILRYQTRNEAEWTTTMQGLAW